MRKAFILFCLFSVAFSGEVLAQEVEADSISKVVPYRNSVYAELLGNSLLGSLNYERVFGVASGNAGLALRIGGFFSADNAGRSDYIIMCPLETSVFWGKQFCRPETGFGLTYYSRLNYRGSEREKSTYLIPAFRIGARFVKPESRFLCRVGFTLLFLPEPLREGLIKIPPVLPWTGISLGYSFGKK